MAVNPTIGKVICPFSGKWGEVRKDKRGKLYYVSDAGMIKPNLPAGQEWILENAEMFAAPVEDPPVQFGRRLVEESEIKAPPKAEPKPEPARKVPETTDEDDDDWLPW